jgi:hypothetical protein
MSIPGLILSQLAMSTSPSKSCERTCVSTMSAMRSRWASTYRMPSCPMATPSHGAGTLNSTAIPPAAWMPSFTFCPSAARWEWPVVSSEWEFATAMSGFFPSCSVAMPVPFMIDVRTIPIRGSPPVTVR